MQLADHQFKATGTFAGVMTTLVHVFGACERGGHRLLANFQNVELIDEVSQTSLEVAKLALEEAVARSRGEVSK